MIISLPMNDSSNFRCSFEGNPIFKAAFDEGKTILDELVLEKIPIITASGEPNIKRLYERILKRTIDYGEKLTQMQFQQQSECQFGRVLATNSMRVLRNSP